jgi:hypothetical protein
VVEASRTLTPSCAWVAEPVSMSCLATLRAWSIGIEKPRPIEPD